MHKITLTVVLLIVVNIIFAQVGGGPLTGNLVCNKGQIKAKWGDELIFEFKVKNSGKGDLKVLDLVTACECQTTYPSNIQTIKSGEYGEIKIKVIVSKQQLGNQVNNGVIEYNKPISLTTDGKKKRYELYTRARIVIE
jgi:hypothetical protein